MKSRLIILIIMLLAVLSSVAAVGESRLIPTPNPSPALPMYGEGVRVGSEGEQSDLVAFFEYAIERFGLKFIGGGLALLLYGVEIVQWVARKYTQFDPQAGHVALIFIVALVGIKGLVNSALIDETQLAVVVDFLSRVVEDFGPWLLGTLGIQFLSASWQPHLKARGTAGFQSKAGLKKPVVAVDLPAENRWQG